MADGRDEERSRLLQAEHLHFIKFSLGKDPWVTVYRHQQTSEFFDFFSALVPARFAERAMSKAEWDLLIGDAEPGFITYRTPNGRARTRYFRFGNDDGIEPLVLIRHFPSGRRGYIELSEEFRQFYNLFDDASTGTFLWCDHDGNEEESVRLGTQEVTIKRQFLLDFLAAKGMHLLIFFDGRTFSRFELKELGVSARTTQFRQGNLTYDLRVTDYRDPVLQSNSFSRLLGKALILHPDKRLSKFSGRQKKPYCEFIIGIDDKGQSMLRSCDYERLAARDYLTPVFFRREVLQKYYENPHRYSVEDGYLRCGSLWGLQIDNSSPRFVVAFLGDLGRDLSVNERLHWRSYNVPPEGGISRTSFARSFEGHFVNPEMPDLLFKQRYEHLNRMWEETFGWPLFRPLTTADEHVFKSIRIPLSENQHEFDQQVLYLAKVLVDALNEEKVEAGMPPPQKDEKGLMKLEKFVNSMGWHNCSQHLDFLRKLQTLRSTGSAHHKGKNYAKAAASFRLREQGFVNTAHLLFRMAIDLLTYFETQLRQHH